MRVHKINEHDTRFNQIDLSGANEFALEHFTNEPYCDELQYRNISTFISRMLKIKFTPVSNANDGWLYCSIEEIN